MLIIFKKSPLALNLAYAVGARAEVADVLGIELIRDGFANEIKSDLPKKTEVAAKATKKKTKIVSKTK